MPRQKFEYTRDQVERAERVMGALWPLLHMEANGLISPEDFIALLPPTMGQRTLPPRDQSVQEASDE